MRKLWECKEWSLYINTHCRKGIRLRFDADVNAEVKRSCKEYIKWLRTQYEFPMRVPIYFREKDTVVTLKGENVSAIFFGPYDKDMEPYIKIAVGDYPELLKKYGKDDALAMILCSITHELSHYFQWIKNEYGIDEKKEERQARYYAREIILDYAETRDHP